MGAWWEDASNRRPGPWRAVVLRSHPARARGYRLWPGCAASHPASGRCRCADGPDCVLPLQKAASRGAEDGAVHAGAAHLAHEAVAGLGEGHHRGGGAAALCVGDDGGLAALHRCHCAVGGACRGWGWHDTALSGAAARLCAGRLARQERKHKPTRPTNVPRDSPRSMPTTCTAGGGKGREAGWSASRRAAARSCTQRHQQALAARAAAAPPPLQAPRLAYCACMLQACCCRLVGAGGGACGAPAAQWEVASWRARPQPPPRRNCAAPAAIGPRGWRCTWWQPSPAPTLPEHSPFLPPPAGGHCAAPRTPGGRPRV